MTGAVRGGALSVESEVASAIFREARFSRDARLASDPIAQRDRGLRGPGRAEEAPRSIVATLGERGGAALHEEAYVIRTRASTARSGARSKISM